MTYSEIRPLWWSMFWRYVLVVAIASVLIGGVLGAVMAMIGYREYTGLVCGAAGLLLHIPGSLWALRAALLKHKFTQTTLAECF